MREKTMKANQIKKKYLRKLSMELIKRGSSNDQIKSTLDDVSFSVDDYISEFKPKNIKELEDKFGSPQDFCDNNSIVKSKVAALGQWLLLLLMTGSILVVPILSISSLFSVYLLPKALIFATFAPNFVALGINGANSGYGLIGTIFGLNVYIWILYQFYKDKFSPFDIRGSVNSSILALYWFLVVFCLYPILHSYISHYEVIVDMWNQNMKIVVLEGIFRWLALLTLLIITAVFYSTKYCKHHLKKKTIEQNKYLIDNIGMLVSVFILTGFISPGPGIGIIIIAIGIGVIFLKRLKGSIWILGGLSLLLQMALSIIEIILIEIEEPIFHFRRTRIIFGILTHNAGNLLLLEVIIAFCLVIIWSILGIRILKKNKQRILPRFDIPKGKTKIVSMLIVIIALVSVLGTQPQRVRFPHNIIFYQNHESGYFEIDQYFIIPGRGKLFISFYTYIEQTDTITYSNGTILDQTSHLVGTWFLTWTPRSFPFRTFRIDGDFKNYTTPSYCRELSYSNSRINVSIQYLVFEINEPGVIQYFYRVYPSIDVLPNFQMQWTSAIPWFLNWYDITIFVCVILLFFFKWDEKELQLSSNLKKGED